MHTTTSTRAGFACASWLTVDAIKEDATAWHGVRRNDMDTAAGGAVTCQPPLGPVARDSRKKASTWSSMSAAFWRLRHAFCRR